MSKAILEADLLREIREIQTEINSIGTVVNNPALSIVTSLPGSPVIGQTTLYQADKTNGVYWRLVYDGEGEYPWKKIGGPPLAARSDIERTLNNAAYTSLPTDPLSITAPLKGDYDVTIEGGVFNIAAGRVAFLSYAVGATAANDNWCIAVTSASTSYAAESLKTRQTGVVAGASIAEKARTEGGEGSFRRRRLYLDPIRVG